MRTGLTVLFKLLGCQAQFTYNLATARAAATQEHFDVLLSDINLPDGDGWTLMRELRETGRKPRVAIAMSGFGGDRDICESKEAGFDLHLVKPFAPEELTKILQRAAEDVLASEPRVASPRVKKKLAHVRAAGESTAIFYPMI